MIMCVWWDLTSISQQLGCSNISWVYWMARQGGDWNSLATKLGTSWLLSCRWRQFLSVMNPPSCHTKIVCVMGPNIHFTAAWLFQCLIISILNGKTRWILEFICHNAKHKLSFELQVRDNFIWGLPSYHTKIVCVMLPDIRFTASRLSQCLIMSILRGKTRWRLEFIGHNAQHKLSFELRLRKILHEITSYHTKIIQC